MDNIETWRPVVGYEGLYEVSDWGRVRSLDHYGNSGIGIRKYEGCILKPLKHYNTYLFVSLYKDGIGQVCSIHRLVAEAFPDMVGWTEDAIGKPFDELQVNHKDKDRTNNRVENLEWCTQQYNNDYSLAKIVYMYTLDGSLCGMWPSTAECDRNGYNHGHVAACCRGVKKTHKGFKWSYEPPKPLLALPYYR